MKTFLRFYYVYDQPCSVIYYITNSFEGKKNILVHYCLIDSIVEGAPYKKLTSGLRQIPD
jgi:hypothetical protein